MRNFLKIILLIMISISIISCKRNHKEEAKYLTLSANETFDCGAFCDPPSITYELPDDSECAHSSQNVLNCFAWKNFLALNWKASNERGLPDITELASNYGMPGDYSPTVWESMYSIEDVFTEKEPQKWNLNGKNGTIKYLKEINKFGDLDEKISQKSLKTLLGDNIDEIMQAEGAWLTDQSGNVVWYEIKINTIESDFIRHNKLYKAKDLKLYAAANNGVWLPTESMELKAAWRIIPEEDLDSLKAYYKISKAMVPEILGFDSKDNPIYGKYTEKYLGLTGLHIIRKTSASPQFIWMTFEHVNNAPTEGKIDKSKKYTFYNPLSTEKPNQSPVAGKDKLNKPVQVTRIANNALTADIQKLNKQVKELIIASNPNSVWQYYQLINVQWPENPVEDNANNKQVPLQEGGITPTNIANITMETYVQEKYCMQCHKNASVIGTKLPTDYSFIFLKVKPDE